jgi:hypothetical protein
MIILSSFFAFYNQFWPICVSPYFLCQQCLRDSSHMFYWSLKINTVICLFSYVSIILSFTFCTQTIGPYYCKSIILYITNRHIYLSWKNRIFDSYCLINITCLIHTMTYSLIVPFIFRFLAAPAAIAVLHLGTPSAHLDSGDCQLLQHLGYTTYSLDS